MVKAVHQYPLRMILSENRFPLFGDHARGRTMMRRAQTVKTRRTGANTVKRPLRILSAF
jgi:hypothetical protein